MLEGGILYTLLAIFFSGVILTLPDGFRPAGEKKYGLDFLPFLLLAAGIIGLILYRGTGSGPVLFTVSWLTLFLGILSGSHRLRIFFHHSPPHPFFYVSLFLFAPALWFGFLHLERERSPGLAEFGLSLLLFYLSRNLLLKKEQSAPYPGIQIILVVFSTSLAVTFLALAGFGISGYIWEPFTASSVHPLLLSTITIAIITLVAGFSLLQSTIQEKELTEERNDLKNQIESRDSFINIIAHDLRGPLGTLLNGLELLRETSFQSDGPPLENDIEEDEFEEFNPSHMLDLLIDQSRATGDRIERLLLWARSQQGKLTFATQPCNLSALVSSEIALLSREIKEKEKVLDLDIKKDAMIIADEKSILFIIRNLFSNAIRFNSPSAMIKVRLNTDESEAELSFQDSGKGFTPEAIKSVSCDVPCTGTYDSLGKKGSGLGLILCKQFAEKNGGSLFIENLNEEGARVGVRFPLNEDAIPAEEDSPDFSA